MKILFIADSTSIHTKRWIHFFGKLDYDISLITIGKKKERLKGVNHIINFEKFYYSSPYWLWALYKTKRIVKKLKPHILHAHFVHQYGWLAALSGYHPMVITAWGTDILSLPKASRSGIGKLLTKYALKKADLITGTSEYLKAEMIKLGAQENKIKVIYWGVNPTKFNPDSCDYGLKQRLRIKTDQPVVLSNRNHIALYNNDIVLKSMKLVLNKFPNAVLVLQNAGGLLEKKLKDLARKENIYNSIRFLPQFRHNEMPSLYAMADVYVSVPSWDAGPVSLKEAMACGVAPIISDIPGPKEWIENGINGKIVPVRDKKKLAIAICDLLSSQKLREKFSKTNAKLIREKANHDDIMEKVKVLYESLV